MEVELLGVVQDVPGILVEQGVLLGVVQGVPLVPGILVVWGVLLGVVLALGVE